MVQNVKRAANAHGSARFVPIRARRDARDLIIPGTVAKRTNPAMSRCATRAGVCRILAVAAEVKR
jgi:hypothetical protein